MKAKSALIASVAMLGLASMANAQTFSNATDITIPDSGAASPYPSTIAVAGMAAGPWDLNATLTGLTHTSPLDIDILLVGPGAAGNLIIMSDTGGFFGPALPVTLVFSDGSPPIAPAGPLVSGTFGASNVVRFDVFPAPAPAASAGVLLNTLATGAVNGTWSLYVFDDAGEDVGTISGWSLTFSVIPSPGALALLGFAGVVGRRRRT